MRLRLRDLEPVTRSGGPINLAEGWSHQAGTGYTPAQLPVLSGIARDFGVFDHWFSEVPSQTFTNRSFWTAATSSGLVVNSPTKKWFTKNDAETIFERLERHGKTWKVYVDMRVSLHGILLASARLMWTRWSLACIARAWRSAARWAHQGSMVQCGRACLPQPATSSPSAPA